MRWSRVVRAFFRCRAPPARDTSDVSDPKTSLRREIAARLSAMSPDERRTLGALAVQRLLASPAFSAARTVVAYASADPEVDTAALLTETLAAGKRFGLPRTERAGHAMQFHTVTNPAVDLEIRHFRFPEPRAELPVIPISEIDLVVVPGLAFDSQGNRLGRGAGYYDRFLAHPDLKAACVALAFDCQIVDSVPVLPHDVRIATIYTDTRTIDARIA
jgi:5-formyltetrahydrofolate cyclo-ligase